MIQDSIMRAMLTGGSTDDEDGSTPSSDSESSSDELDHGELKSKKSPVQYLLTLIFDHVRSLYKISVLLRRPAIHDKYIRSVSKDENISCFAYWEKDHVAEKMTQWALDKDLRYEKPIGHDHPLAFRLAMANIRRREQLKHWQRHPDRPSIFTAQASGLPELLTAPAANLKVETRSQPDKKRSSFLEKITSNTATTGRETKQSFSTVAASILNDHETVTGRAKTEYALSAHGGGKTLRIPDIPEVPKNTLVFDCPYCFSKLEVNAMKNRRLWK
jgi:hypothetical protein